MFRFPAKKYCLNRETLIEWPRGDCEKVILELSSSGEKTIIDRSAEKLIRFICKTRTASELARLQKASEPASKILDVLIENDFLVPSSLSRRLNRGLLTAPRRTSLQKEDFEATDSRAPFFGCPVDFANEPPRTPCGGPMALRRVMNNRRALCDLGDVISYPDEGIDGVGSRITHIVSKSLGFGRPFVMVGGDHSLTFFSARALSWSFPKIRIIQFDAHSDMYEAAGRGSARYEPPLNHANVFNHISKLPGQIDLIQFGIRDNLSSNAERFILNNMSVVRLPSSETSLHGLKKEIEEGPVLPTYLSIDLDVVDPCYAPWVTTPSRGGITPDLLHSCLKLVFDMTKEVVGADIVELCAAQSDSIAHGKSCDAEITAVCAAGCIDILQNGWGY